MKLSQRPVALVEDMKASSSISSSSSLAPKLSLMVATFLLPVYSLFFPSFRVAPFVNEVKRDYIEVWDKFRRSRASLFHSSRMSHASQGGLSCFRVN